jgi:hypothetical protein
MAQQSHIFYFAQYLFAHRARGLHLIERKRCRCAIMADMAKNQVKDILDRVLSWPTERQKDVAHVVEMMEEQDKSGLRLTDAQAAEVRRRLADPSRKTIPAEQVFKRFRSSSA